MVRMPRREPLDSPEFIGQQANSQVDCERDFALSHRFGECLPVSLQLLGRAFDEAMLFRVGRAYERAEPWAAMRPRLVAP